MPIQLHVYKKTEARQSLPTRIKSDNKTRGGKTLLVAGSKDMEGAAILAARAAARVGAGYVYIHSKTPTVPDFLRMSSIKDFDPLQFSAVGVGPGFKDSTALNRWIKHLEKLRFESVVLDAEALNFLSETKSIKKIPSTWIMTPHEGELARLLHVRSSAIRKNRQKFILQAQKKFGCIILLKGAGTLIADAKHLVRINTGNPALSKAGTGDVLTGMITGFLSQKVKPFEAACLGAYVHGLVADLWIKKGHDVLSLMASDLIEGLPEALFKLRKNQI